MEARRYAQDPARSAEKPLLCTQYPYYLVKQRDPNVEESETWIILSENMDTTYFDGETLTAAEGKNFMAAIQAFYQTGGEKMKEGDNQDLKDLFEAFKEAKATAMSQMEPPDPKEWALSWIRDRVFDAWPHLSHVTPENHRGMGLHLADNHQLIGTLKAIDWYRIESRDNDSDGTVLVKYNGDNGETQLHPNPAQPPPTQPSADSKPVGGGVVDTANLGSIDPNAQGVEDESTEPPPKRQKTGDFPVTVAGLSAYGDSGPTCGEESVEMQLLARKEIRHFVERFTGHRERVSDIPSESKAKAKTTRRAKATPQQQPATNYYICASTVNFNVSDPPGVSHLATTNPMNSFLSTLHLQGLVLQGKPKPGVPMPLDAGDELQAWFGLALGVKASQQPTGAVTVDAGGGISDFQLVLPGPSDGTGISSLTYSLGNATDSLGVDAALFLPVGKIIGQNVLVLGLEASAEVKTTSLSLADIMAPSTNRGGTPAALAILEAALGDDKGLQIDTSSGSRNAIWFDPGSYYKTVVRTQYIAGQSTLDAMNKWITNRLSLLSDLSFTNITVITKLQSSWRPTNAMPVATNEWEFIFHAGLAIAGLDIAPSVTVDFAGQLVTMILQLDYKDGEDTDKAFSDMISWLFKHAGVDDIDTSTWFGAGGTSFGGPVLRRITLSIDLGKSTPKIEDFRVDIEIDSKVGAPDGQTVVFLFSFNWSGGVSTLRGSLWTRECLPLHFLGVSIANRNGLRCSSPTQGTSRSTLVAGV
jgi:hypothetical protein